jgi:gliding motility-associated-like protein
MFRSNTQALFNRLTQWALLFVCITLVPLNSLLGQTPLKIKAVTSGFYSPADSAVKTRTGIELNDFNSECNTQTFKMKLMAPVGEKVSLVSFLYLPSGNILILSNTYNINGQTNGWLTTMRNDGTILNHQKMLLEGNLRVELFEGNANLSGRITISGKIANGGTQSFVCQMNTNDYSAIWTRKFNHQNQVEEISIGVFEDSLISFATRINNEIQFGVLTKDGSLQWSRTFSHPAIKKLVGIEGSYSGNIPLIMALNVLEGGKIKVLMLEHEPSNGVFKAAHFAGNNSNDQYSGTDIKSFNDRVILSGNYFESSSSSRKLFRHILYGTQKTETVHTYNGVPPVNDSTQLVMSVAGEWLSWIPDNQGAVSFIRHPAYYQIGPEKGGTIEVAGALETKAAAAMGDGGYLMGINLKDKSAIYLVKTDSIGRMAGCSTQTFDPGYQELIEEDNAGSGYSSTSFIILSEFGSLQYQASTVSANFECKGLFCPPAPLADSCLNTFYKTYRSNSYVSAFGYSFDLNDDLAILTSRYSQLSGGLNSVTQSLKIYDKQGKFKRGVRYLFNGQPIDLSVFPLTKTSFLGLFYITPTSNDSTRFLIALMDKQLQPVWTRWISFNNPSPFYSGGPGIADATMDDDGNIYIMGTTLGYMEKPRITIHKLNNEGNAEWTSSIAVDKTNLGIARIKSLGNHLLIVAEGGIGGSISLRVNKKTGDPINAFLFDNVSAGYAYRRTFDWMGDRFLYGGHKSGDNFIMASFDSTGKPLKIRQINNSSIIRAGAVANGHLYADFYYFNGTETKQVLLKADSNLNLVYAREYEMERARNPGGLHILENGEILETGNFYFGGVNSYYVDPYIRKYDEAGNLGTCANIGMPNSISEVGPNTEAISAIRVPQSISTYSGLDITIVEVNEGERVADILCKSSTNCSTIDIKGQDTICNLSETYLFQADLNNACTLRPSWSYDTAFVQVVKQEANQIELKFKKPGKHFLKANINAGCTIIRDSLLVEVQNNLATLSLGPDTTLCPGDSLLLNAGTGFAAYQWSTGSVDSSIWVSKAGKYSVIVENTCGAPLTDTIEIFMPLVPVLSAGTDSSVCVGLIFERLASAGFASYQWKNLVTQTVVSNIRLLSGELNLTTSFALQAATTLGCTRHDTLNMTAISARPFSLGANQNLCAGDTATFSAPTGYASYTWNTGSNTNSIKAWQQGQYTLSITDTNGCKTADTVSITNVFPLPRPNLGSDKSICAGSSLVLTPGTFSRYVWQNGSTSASFTAGPNGTYSVQVWNNNGCTASDTMQILSQLPLPSSFLATTDSICQYEKLALAPSGSYVSYVWSTGSTQPTLQVDKPGIYGLTVTDSSNCTGADSIRVIQKACMEGVYIPTAFTPNNDNLNDVFRPMVFGIVVKFEFSLYNRFGELIYQTNEPGKGWDGRWKGILQPANTYAWVCSYQLEGGEAKVEKGMVSLIR